MLFLAPHAWCGEREKPVKVMLRSRMSAFYNTPDYGFKSDFLRITASGDLGGGFRFLFRQRLDRAPTVKDFLSATDYLNVSWRRGDWELLGGKTYLACGGFDYLSTTYDLYIKPVYFGGLGGMYNYAVQVRRYFGSESLCIQAGNSIYSLQVSNLLGASMLLRGRAGAWEHAWSVNYFEREKGLGNFFCSLGNRFHLGEKCIIDLGLAHRMDCLAPTFMKDFSVVLHYKHAVTDWMNLVAKATWDYKETGIEDPLLPDGTNIRQAGGGVEYFPIKASEAVRLHAIYYHRSTGENCLMAGVSFTVGN